MQNAQRICLSGNTQLTLEEGRIIVTKRTGERIFRVDVDKATFTLKEGHFGLIGFVCLVVGIVLAIIPFTQGPLLGLLLCELFAAGAFFIGIAISAFAKIDMQTLLIMPDGAGKPSTFYVPKSEIPSLKCLLKDIEILH